MLLNFLKPKFQAVITIIFAVLEEGIRLQSRKKVVLIWCLKTFWIPGKKNWAKNPIKELKRQIILQIIEELHPGDAHYGILHRELENGSWSVI